MAGTQAALPPARLLILTAHKRCGVAIIRDSRCRLKRRDTRQLRNWGPKPVRTLEYSHALWHTRRVTVA